MHIYPDAIGDRETPIPGGYGASRDIRRDGTTPCADVAVANAGAPFAASATAERPTLKPAVLLSETKSEYVSQ
jgi:hypothetical protein